MKIIRKKKLKEIQEGLDFIYTDLLMLQEGSWTPDESSVEASLDTVRSIGNLLQLEIKDVRHENSDRPDDL